MSDYNISFDGMNDAVVSFDCGDVYDVHFYGDSKDFSISKRSADFTPAFKPFLFLVLIIGCSIMLSEVVKNAPMFIFPAMLGALLGLSPITKMLFGFGFIDVLFLIFGKGNFIFSFGLILWWCLYFAGVTNEMWQVILGVPCMYGMYFYPFYSIVSSKDGYYKFFAIAIPLITILGGFVCFFSALIFIPNFQDTFTMSPIILPTSMGLLVNFLSFVRYLFEKYYEEGMKLTNFFLAFIGIVILFFSINKNILICLLILALSLAILLFPIFSFFFKQAKNLRKVKKIVSKDEKLKRKKIKLKSARYRDLIYQLAIYSDKAFFVLIFNWWLFSVFFDLSGIVMYISGTIIFWYIISYIYHEIKKIKEKSYKTKNIVILSFKNLLFIAMIVISYVLLIGYIKSFTIYVTVLIPTILFVLNLLLELLQKITKYRMI